MKDKSWAVLAFVWLIGAVIVALLGSMPATLFCVLGAAIFVFLYARFQRAK